MLPKHSILLSEQLQSLFQLGHLLILGLADALDQLDDLPILARNRLPQYLVLSDQHLRQFGGLGELQHPAPHVPLQGAIAALEIEDYLGEVGVGIGDDALLVVLFVGGLGDEPAWGRGYLG